jgi:D-arabinose 1-dehydrogenase-like Zn-dependent alcohol dehydrogenase
MVIWGGLSSLFSDRKVKLLLAPLGATRLPEILEAGQSGLLKPVISAQVPLAEAREALNRMGAGDLPGKLVITP